MNTDHIFFFFKNSVLPGFYQVALIALPAFLVLDVWLTYWISKHYPEIENSYYRKQKEFGIWKANGIKILFVLFGMWCSSHPTPSLGKTPNLFIPLIYMVTVPIYFLEFLRHRWRVKHGLVPSTQEEGKKGDKETN